MVPNLSPKCKLFRSYFLFMPFPSPFHSWSTLFLHVLLLQAGEYKVVFFLYLCHNVFSITLFLAK